MRVFQNTQKILLDISIALGCPTEMEASIYYSGNHAHSQGSEVHKIELMWKTNPCRLTFLLPEGALQTSKGWTQSIIVLYKYYPCEW